MPHGIPVNLTALRPGPSGGRPPFSIQSGQSEIRLIGLTVTTCSHSTIPIARFAC